MYELKDIPGFPNYSITKDGRVWSKPRKDRRGYPSETKKGIRYMRDPNRGTSEETLRRFREAAYEQCQSELISAITMLLRDHKMTWDDLAGKLHWRSFASKCGLAGEHDMGGSEVKRTVGVGVISLLELNDIAHVFSTRPMVTFVPRLPHTNT